MKTLKFTIVEYNKLKYYLLLDIKYDNLYYSNTNSIFKLYNE